MSKNYNRHNFHKHTFCIFHEADQVTVNGLNPNYKSKSGSSYYFTEDGVYRLSDHWGRAANCRWRLERTGKPANKFQLGFARWTDFHPDNEVDKLYFIEADFDNQTVQFFHKESKAQPPDALLRTAAETTKRIKQIRQLLEETAWAKYLKGEDIALLRREIISKLINSDETLQEIRKAYL